MNDESRMRLWEAFSNLFLDTELTDSIFIYVARVVEQSGVSLTEAEAVLWNEVFPVLHHNLRSVAGEWTGWSRDWLKAHLRPSKGPARHTGPKLAVQEIQRSWAQVLRHCNSRASA